MRENNLNGTLLLTFYVNYSHIINYKHVFLRRLYSANDPIWLTQGCPNHLLNSLAKILDQFANCPNIVAFSERWVQ